MTPQYIRVESDQGVARVTLDRPDVLNSFNREMAGELQSALAAAARDDSVRALLLTGTGRAFCAGQDLAEAVPVAGGAMPDLGDIVRTSYSPIIRAIRRVEKPVICAVNGVAAGAGANLALACDIVFAATDASFVQSFAKVGLVPDSGGTFILPRIVGLARATAMMMLAERVTALEAKDAGMIFKVVEPTALLDVAFATAVQLAAMATRGLGLIKRGLNSSLGIDLDRQLDVEEELQREAGSTADYAEGVRAFLDKRKPRFTGR